MSFLHSAVGLQCILEKGCQQFLFFKNRFFSFEAETSELGEVNDFREKDTTI